MELRNLFSFKHIHLIENGAEKSRLNQTPSLSKEKPSRVKAPLLNLRYLLIRKTKTMENQDQRPLLDRY